MLKQFRKMQKHKGKEEGNRIHTLKQLDIRERERDIGAFQFEKMARNQLSLDSEETEAEAQK